MNKIASEVLYKTLEVGVGIIVGLICSKWVFSTPDSTAESFIIGLMATLVLTVWVEFRRVSTSFDELLEKHEKELKGIGQAAPFLKPALYCGMQPLNEHEIHKEWFNVVLNSKTAYVATSYVSEESWRAGYHVDMLELQAIIKKLRPTEFTVLRIFIVDSNDELKRLKSTIERHHAADVQVQYILKKKADELKGKYETVETIDFAVSDKATILAWHMCPNSRTVQRGTIISVTDIDASPYYQFLLDLSRNAEKTGKSNGQQNPENWEI